MPAWRMVAASGAKKRAVSSQLEATRVPARRMVVAGAASTWAAPRELLLAAHSAARRMVGASAASKTAAPSQLFEFLVPCTAGFVCRMRSPMMHSRPHCNSSDAQAPQATAGIEDYVLGLQESRRRVES